MSLDSSLQAGDPRLDEAYPTEPPHFSRPRFADDLRVPWGFRDLVLLVGLAIVAFLVLIAFDVVGVRLGVFRTSLHDQSVFSVIGQAAVDLALLGYLALHIRSKFREPFWTTIGWRALDTSLVPRPLAYAGLALAGVLISLLVDAASNMHPPKGNLPIDTLYQDPLSAFLFLLMAVLLAPVVEETIFRGYIYPVIGKRWGVAAGVLITGTLFGLLHGFQLGGALWQISLLVIVGIIFTWLRASTGTVLASYFLHLGYNSFLFVGFLASTHFLRSMPGTH